MNVEMPPPAPNFSMLQSHNPRVRMTIEWKPIVAPLPWHLRHPFYAAVLWGSAAVAALHILSI